VQLEHFAVSSKGDVLWAVRETDFNNFLRVESSMEILRLAKWVWNCRAASIVCLPHTAQVNSPGDFLDHNWRQLLLSELLVDAQEVDAANLEGVLIDLHLSRCARDKSQQLVFTLRFDTNVPVLVVSWNLQDPSEQLNWVVESKDTMLIFDVVFSK